MNKIKEKMVIFFCLLLLPINILAYSDKIILGGANVGINIQNNGIIIIGFYRINGEYNKGDNELNIGDVITKVANSKVSSIKELTDAIEKNVNNNEVTLYFKRNGKEEKTNLKLYKENDIYKTGLYVKDSVKGIGTISYIDPETKIYGSLGHEIIETNSNNKIEVKSGYIFESSIIGIDKSYDGYPGEKKANFNNTNKLGTIDKNTIYGIFGKYSGEILDNNLIEVADKNEIKIGKAYIYTVLDNNSIGKYEIEITNINENASIKNISFEITDKTLLEKTGGIVQGMSGSPIVQNDKIIGVVTHVVIDHVNTGYGIFITTMLEEGEKNN